MAARALFGRDWWPAEARHPVLRLILGMLAAPLLLAALATLAAFLIAGSALPDGATVMAATRAAGLAAFAAFPAFAASFGLAAVLILWALRRRRALVFAATGAAAGALFALFTSVAFGTPLTPVAPLILAGMGSGHMLLVRRIAGLRPFGAHPLEAPGQ